MAQQCAIAVIRGRKVDYGKKVYVGQGWQAD